MQSGKDSVAPSNVPLLDVGRGNAPIRERFLQRIAEIYDQGCFIGGPDCKELERLVAEACGVEYAIGCASGSDALLLALMAFDIGHGDEVIVPSFTFFATASAVARLGARPVFVDIDPVSFNINPELIHKHITPRTRAIIPVHLFGQCADMNAINEIAQRYGLVVIEDAAQAIGAQHAAQPACSISDVGCLSFYPTKNLGGCGDGGMVTARDADVADRLRKLANHGMHPRYHHSLIGINSRLDTFQAAMLAIKMEFVEQYADARRANAARYQSRLGASKMAEWLELPSESEGNHHVWNQFTIRVKGGLRDRVREDMRQAGVGSEVYYPIPLHLQECFQYLGVRHGSLPQTEKAAAEVLSLPIFPELTAAELDRAIDVLESTLARMSQTAAA